MEAEYGLTASAFGSNEADNSLAVKFFKLPQENKVKSSEEGRPIFEECDFIEISIPGNNDNIIVHKARDHDKQRFPRHWEAYLKRTGDDETVIGTLLDEWPGCTRSQVEELKFYHIRTVEQLASIADSNAQNLRGAVTLKQKAQKYLETSMSNEELQKQLVAQKAQIDALIAAAGGDVTSDESPKKRGRPKKDALEV